MLTLKSIEYTNLTLLLQDWVFWFLWSGWKIPVRYNTNTQRECYIQRLFVKRWRV